MLKQKITNFIFPITYLYAIIPILLFFTIWLRWYYAVIATVLIAYGFIRLCNNLPDTWKPELSKKNLKVLLIALAIIIAWVYLSGIGGFVYQNSDHTVRNEIYEILVNKSWPVIKQVELDGWLKDRGMIYYIAFWLPAALFGKAFGIQAGYVFQAVWAVIGIWLFYYMICLFLKKISILPLVVFILFSGLDTLGMHIFWSDTQFLNRSWHIEHWASGFQFSSFTTQLFWVFNQALPLWLFTMLILLQRNNKQIVFLMGLAVLYGPFPFIGLIPICIVAMFGRRYDGTKGAKNWIISFLKDTFTIENVLCGGFIGIISYLYLRGNVASQNIEAAAEDINPKGFFFMYIFFFLLEAGVYFIAVAKNFYKDKFFYAALLSLLVAPLIRIGYSVDFCMRASIPALIVLYLMVIRSMYEYKKSKDFIRLAVLIVLFAIGAMTPFREFDRTFLETRNLYLDNADIGVEKSEEDNIFTSPNFSGDTEDNFFYEKLAR